MKDKNKNINQSIEDYNKYNKKHNFTGYNMTHCRGFAMYFIDMIQILNYN